MKKHKLKLPRPPTPTIMLANLRSIPGKLRNWNKNRLLKVNKGFAGGLVVGFEKESKMENIYYLSDDVHSLTVGATRSGKSRCIVLQSIAYTAISGESMVVNDPKGELAFIILPDEKTTFYSLASLFVYQHYVSLTENADDRGGRLKIRVNFFLDEFGNFTEIPAFSNMLTVGGGRGIRFNLFMQSFSQIEEKYGKEQSETIKDNCHCWVYLKMANVETASQITKKLGQYTTSSYSRSSSYSSGSHNSNANLQNTMNLLARSLLTEDEILRIERPYVLVMYSGYYPAMMRLPDLSEWKFNLALGLGDKEHNRLVREMREKARVARAPQEIRLWGIWKKYSKSQNANNNMPEHGGMEDEDTELTLPETNKYGQQLPRPITSKMKSAVDWRREGEGIINAFDSFSKANHMSQNKPGASVTGDSPAEKMTDPRKSSKEEQKTRERLNNL